MAREVRSSREEMAFMRDIRMVLPGAVVLAFALMGSGCGSRQGQGASVAQQAQNQPAPATNVQPPVQTNVQPAPASPDVFRRRRLALFGFLNYVPPQPVPPQTAPAPAAISVPAGTVFRVRLDETLDTRHNPAGDPFSATLARGIVEHGTMIIPDGDAVLRASGSRVEAVWEIQRARGIELEARLVRSARAAV